MPGVYLLDPKVIKGRNFSTSRTRLVPWPPGVGGCQLDQKATREKRSSTIPFRVLHHRLLRRTPTRPPVGERHTKAPLGAEVKEVRPERRVPYNRKGKGNVLHRVEQGVVCDQDERRGLQPPVRMGQKPGKKLRHAPFDLGAGRRPWPTEARQMARWNQSRGLLPFHAETSRSMRLRHLLLVMIQLHGREQEGEPVFPTVWKLRVDLIQCK